MTLKFEEDVFNNITLNDTAFLNSQESDKDIHSTKNLVNKIVVLKSTKDQKHAINIEKSTKNTILNTSLSSWGLPENILSKYKERGITNMFKWQVECLGNRRVLHENCNLVYSAPTSAGKTLVAEILAVKTLLEKQKKVLIILPFVSVVREKMFYFQDIFSVSGIRVEGFMGSHNPPGGFKTVQLAICTIEKANSIVNKMLDEGNLGDIGAIIIDEMHLLGDPSRGYLLELLLTKVRYMAAKEPQINIQLIGMSATLPNLDVLAKWLNAELFTTTFRPIPLHEFSLVSGEVYNNEFKLQRKLLRAPDLTEDTDNILQLCLETIKLSCSILIFCPTKNWCENLSQQISVAFSKLGRTKSLYGQCLREQLKTDAISEILEQLKRCPVGLDAILKKSVSFGVSFHHAGLTMDERDIIEGAFRSGALRVLIATSTLSSGVNLPAQRVIIRTPMFHGKPIDTLTYRQMIGRAGRMGKDTSGESILICQKTDKRIAMELMSARLQPIESCLEGAGKLKRAILEVIASGVANTPEEVTLFTNCTLLATGGELGIVNPIDESVKFLESNEFIRLQKDEDGKLKYIATSLAKACLSSSLPPEEGLALFEEVEKARQCLVLDTELHLLYLVTPYSVCNQWSNLDWMLYLDMWEKLPPSMKRVAEMVGVKESYIFHATRGRINTSSSKLYHKLQIHRRFYTALALQDLVNETPLNVVANKFQCSRGMLQSLQQSASMFAGMVTSFCHQLKWKCVEILISQFQDRLQFGIHHELLDLMKLPSLNGPRARTLYNAGIETLTDLASFDVCKLENILHCSIPFQSEKERDGETAYDVEQKKKMRGIWITGKQGLTAREAADLLIKESRKYLQFEVGAAVMQWDNTVTNGSEHPSIAYASSTSNNTSINIIENRHNVNEEIIQTQMNIIKLETSTPESFKTPQAIDSEELTPKSNNYDQSKSKNINLLQEPPTNQISLEEEAISQKVSGNNIIMNISNFGKFNFQNSNKYIESSLNKADLQEAQCISFQPIDLNNTTFKEPKSEMKQKSKGLINAEIREITQNETFNNNLNIINFEDLSGNLEISKDTSLNNVDLLEENMSENISFNNLNTTNFETNISKNEISKDDMQDYNWTPIENEMPTFSENLQNNKSCAKNLSTNELNLNISTTNNNKVTPSENSIPTFSIKEVNLNASSSSNRSGSLFEESICLDSKLCDVLDCSMKSNPSKLNIEMDDTSFFDQSFDTFQIKEQTIEKTPEPLNTSETNVSDVVDTSQSELKNSSTLLNSIQDSVKKSKKDTPRKRNRNSLLSEETPNKKQKIVCKPIELDDNIYATEDTTPLDLNSVDIIDVCKNIKLFETFCIELRTKSTISFAVACEHYKQEKPLIGQNVIQLDSNKEKQNISQEKIISGERQVTGIAISWGGNTVYFVSFTNSDYVANNEKVNIIKSVLNNEKLVVKVFDFKEQFKVLYKSCQISINCEAEDPKMADWLLEPEGKEKNLQAMAVKYSPEAVGITQLAGSCKGVGSIALDLHNAIISRIRASIETVVTWHVVESQKEFLSEQNAQLLDTFQVEMKSLCCLTQMEINGLGVDKNQMNKLVTTVQEQMAILQQQAFSLAGRRFEFTSSKDVAKVLGIYKGKRISTNKQTLEQSIHPVANLILQWRKLSCTLTKMLFPIIRSLNGDRIHGNCVTHSATGRISMHEPNLQNVPRNYEIIKSDGTVLALSARATFVPTSTNIFLSADYCQLELRLLAHLSQDSVLCNIMRTGKDVFKLIASKINKVLESQVTDILRQRAKQLCYGIIYGMGTKALSEQLGSSEEEAAEFMEVFRNTYPKIKEFIKNTIQFCREQGYVKTLAGRRRYLPLINNENAAIKSQSERQAVNTSIQGSAADLAKKAMVCVHAEFNKRFPSNLNRSRVSLVLHLHDEFIYEVPLQDLRPVAYILKTTLEQSVQLSIPFPVKLKMGPSWGELSELDL